MEFKPLYYKNNLEIINPEGDTGIITLWSKPDSIKEEIFSKYPSLSKKDSPLVTITSFYGNGFPQMLSNLAYNPQINKIAIVGRDNSTIPSSEYFLNFLYKGVSEVDEGGIKMNQISGTSYNLEKAFHPSKFSHLDAKKFNPSSLEGLLEFVNSNKNLQNNKKREKITISYPDFNDFPSDITSHNIVAKTPLEGWMEVLYNIDRFGKSVNLKKGRRRGLFNLDVNILDPSFENEKVLKDFGFNPEELKKYQESILNSDLPRGISYTYGNRIRSYWGGDSLEKISEALKNDNLNRHGFVSLWDTKQDLLERKSSPCLTDIYFSKNPEKDELMLTSGFRTHNAVSAWLTNMYGLRAIQEKVANDSGIKPGQINVRSRWISIDPENQKTVSSLNKIKNKRKVKLDTHDPKGYYVVDLDKSKNKIVVDHYSPSGFVVEKFSGNSAEEVKNQLRQINGFSNTDHAMWVGMELARVQSELFNNIYFNDR